MFSQAQIIVWEMEASIVLRSDLAYNKLLN